MKVQVYTDDVYVFLSRRNLQQLIQMLDDKVRDAGLRRYDQSSNLRLYVVAEEDEQHYQGREPGLGYQPPSKEQ